MGGRPKGVQEADLGPHVIEWFKAHGFGDVYQEVKAFHGIADLVAVNGPRLAVCELKLALSFELLHQAQRWRDSAHDVWVAVLHARSSEGRRMAERCFERFGIGVLEVDAYPAAWDQDPDPDLRPCLGPKLSRVKVRCSPEFNRRAYTQRIRRHLHEEQKTFSAAGSPGAPHWTPFKQTCEAMRIFLRAHPDGAPVRDVVAGIKHHYSSGASARSHLATLIDRGVIPGVELVAATEGSRNRIVRLKPQEGPST